jgi:hypothetical protein
LATVLSSFFVLFSGSSFILFNVIISMSCKR